LQKRREELERLEKERWAEIRSYKGLMVADKMTSNRQIASASAGKSMREMEDEFV
jgi:DNA-binding FadR family transcriptional regulator